MEQLNDHEKAVGKTIARFEGVAINQLRIHFTDGSCLVVDADSYYLPSANGTVATLGMKLEDN